MKLCLCGGCGRHVRETEAACPFCGARRKSAPCFDGSRALRRMSRAAMMASASTAVALASCSAYGAPHVCSDSVTLASPCGFLSEATTCAGATKTCAVNQNGHTCTFGPIASNCTITVVVGDGTSHTVDVTVQPAPGNCTNTGPIVSSVSNQSFASPSCLLPELPEAGADASSDAPLE